MSPRALLPLASLLALIAALGGNAAAGGPQAVEVAGEEPLAKGTLDSLSLDADGVLRLGATFAAQPLDAPTAWAAVTSGDALWVGCGNDASLRRVDAQGKVETVKLVDGLMVTALAPLPAGGVAAAVFPGGRLVKVGATGASEPLATVPAEHVWALLSDARGALIVASGVPGALWAVDPAGAVTRLCDVDDEHARCLAGTTDDVLVGTAGKGRVLAWKGGTLSVLRDLDQDEVVGLVRLADGSLVVAANVDAGAGNAQQLAALLKQIAQPPATRGEAKVQERASLQDGTLLHLETSGAVTTLWEGKKTALLALAPEGEGAVAGTYPSGRVLRVRPGARSEVLADLPEAEASVLVSDGRGLSAVITSNPCVLHLRRSEADAGVYTSAPLETGAVARWGTLTLRGRGLAAARFRSGETSEPDLSWTPWAPSGGFDGHVGTTGASARFLQVEVRLAGRDAELRGLTVIAQPPNRAPLLSAFTCAKPKATDGPVPDARRELGWKAEDADGDELLTTVEVQRDGSSRWASLVTDEVLATPTTTWDTTGLPDGLYLVRVTLSDAGANAADRARTTVFVSPAQRIDNTAPRVSATARVVGDRLVLEGRASDQPGGRVALVRIALDGGPWRAVSAADGLYDAPDEAFSASLALPPSGEHDLVIQALDADDNPGATGVTVTVPAAR